MLLEAGHAVVCKENLVMRMIAVFQCLEAMVQDSGRYGGNRDRKPGQTYYHGSHWSSDCRIVSGGTVLVSERRAEMSCAL